MSPQAAIGIEAWWEHTSSGENWFFPDELRQGLEPFDLPDKVIDETLACAWEYSRCVIPQHIDWDRFLAFNRTIVIAVIAEFRGDLIPLSRGDRVLGYDLEELLSTLFSGTSMHDAMSREFKTFLLMSAEKSSNRLDTELFRRYQNALAESPKTWFRLRDCDALARYTMASALACNGFDDPGFTEDQWQLVAELADTLYDAVAFYKHRAEREVNSTFGYVGDHMRIESYRLCREILWALDAAWARDDARRCVLNFTRLFGGPIHMTTRRYRFVEDGLVVGQPETEKVVDLTRKNFKLWNRVEGNAASPAEDERYVDVIAQADRTLLPGFCDLLERNVERKCSRCYSAGLRSSRDTRQFGGVSLCDGCKEGWRSYMQSLPARFAAAFPEMRRCN